MNVLLNERDYLLFKFLYERKVADFSMIKDQVFQNIHASNIYRRLKKLARKKLVREYSFIENHVWRRAYSLTKLGLEKVNSYEGADLKFVKALSDKVLHDIKVNMIIDKVLELKCCRDVLRENELMNKENSVNKTLEDFQRVRADGYAEIFLRNETFHTAIEYERSQKKMSRYDSKILSYYNSDYIDSVFYICSTDSLMKSLMNFEKKSCSAFSPMIFYCREKSFLKSKDLITLFDRNGDSLDLEVSKRGE